MNLLELYTFVGFFSCHFALAMGGLAVTYGLARLGGKAGKAIAQKYRAWREARAERLAQQHLEQLKATEEWQALVRENQQIELDKERLREIVREQDTRLEELLEGEKEVHKRLERNYAHDLATAKHDLTVATEDLRLAQEEVTALRKRVSDLLRGVLGPEDHRQTAQIRAGQPFEPPEKRRSLAASATGGRPLSVSP